MSASNPIIEVQNLITHYGDTQVLDQVNMRVEKGEIHVIMGGSGSGKSTLLRHLLGLHQPTEGIIQVLNQNVGKLNRKQIFQLRKQIGVAFQGGALLSSLTVGENIRLPLRMHTALDENTMHIMTRMKLEMMNMADTDHLMPSQLSGGMLKRAGLARAVVMDPGLLFFDEPSAGLDPITSAELDELILLLRDALNMTIVVVTHELESAFKIADKITVLQHGKILMTGTAEEIRNTDNRTIQNMLNRRPREEDIDVDAYLDRLTGANR